METVAKSVIKRWSKNLSNEEMLELTNGMLSNPIDDSNMELCIEIKKQLLNKC
jgi:hypothetical protein